MSREKKDNLTIGRFGENIACEFLKNKGYEIMEQNYRTKYAEIDLVAMKNKEMIFVEVRTKRGEMFGSPEETLSKKKLAKLWGNANAYVARKNWQGPYKIDAVCVVLGFDNALKRIDHYENIC